MRNLLVAGAMVLAGCGLSSESESRVGQNVEYFCKIEGSAIGHDGFVLTLGSKAVRFSDWVLKDGAQTEYVGFSISIAGASSADYVVKAATELFPSSASTWLHPAGPAANAISNVDFCGECEDGSCDGGDDDDGGGSCSCDPDGNNCSGPVLL
jgi:hypothetical protein